MFFVSDYGMLSTLIGVVLFVLYVIMLISTISNFDKTYFTIENNILKCYRGKKLRSQHDIIKCDFSTRIIRNTIVLLIYEDGVLVNDYPIEEEIIEDLKADIVSTKNSYSSSNLNSDLIEVNSFEVNQNTLSDQEQKVDKILE